LADLRSVEVNELGVKRSSTPTDCFVGSLSVHKNRWDSKVVNRTETIESLAPHRRTWFRFAQTRHAILLLCGRVSRSQWAPSWEGIEEGKRRPHFYRETMMNFFLGCKRMRLIDILPTAQKTNADSPAQSIVPAVAEFNSSDGRKNRERRMIPSAVELRVIPLYQSPARSPTDASRASGSRPIPMMQMMNHECRRPQELKVTESPSELGSQ
jgi:hypothetical protein